MPSLSMPTKDRTRVKMTIRVKGNRTAQAGPKNDCLYRLLMLLMVCISSNSR